MTPLPAQRAHAARTLERLYRRHAGGVYRYALAVLHDQSAAAEVTQTTFRNARGALAAGRHPRAAQKWLIGIAHEVCRLRLRQLHGGDDEVADWFVEEDAAPSEEDVRHALSHLPFDQRSALVMRELERRSYGEIAQALGCATGEVETLIFRARRALREQLEVGIACGEAELAISKLLDGRLTRDEKGRLRAHLRACAACAVFARNQRAQRSALRSLGTVPLPESLAWPLGAAGAPDL